MAKNDTERFSKELLDQLLAGRDPKSVLDSGGLIGDLKKALAERMLNAEMDVHLAQETEAGEANHRNGSSAKTVLTPEGSLELSIPLQARVVGVRRQFDQQQSLRPFLVAPDEAQLLQVVLASVRQHQMIRGVFKLALNQRR